MISPQALGEGRIAGSLADCQVLCAATPACTAVEWYETTAGYANKRCHTFPCMGYGSCAGGTTNGSPTQGGLAVLDAKCNAGRKSEITRVVMGLPRGDAVEWGPQNHERR